MALKTGMNDVVLNAKVLPMSMRPQAHDIIRTWAFYTIVKAWMHQNSIPWQDIVISGHVLAGKEKLSKSKDNAPLAPENLLKTYPADAIRYWTASGTLGTDITFSDNQLRIGQRLIVKLWNAFRFAWQHLLLFNPHDHQFSENPQELGIINAWMLHQVSAAYTQYQHYFSHHEFSLALAVVEKLFWRDFCDNYIELIKDILMHPETYDKNHIQMTLLTLYQVGLRILQLYAPFVPYVTETLYEHLYKQHEKILSLHQTKLSAYQIEYRFDEQAIVMEKVLRIIAEIRKLKTEQQLSLKTELATLTIHARTKEALELAWNNEKTIKAMTAAREVVYEQVDSADNLLAQRDGSWHAHIVVA